MVLLTKRKIHANDNSSKYLFELSCGEEVEAVRIPLENEIKACISCQIGCVNKCKHCATGKMDYVRDLSGEEIVAQVVNMAMDNSDDLRKYRVLFMGMGEPFFNFESVLRSLDLFTELGILPSQITISTSGVIPRIYELSLLENRPKLAVSIHATSESMRDKLIPLNKIYNLKHLLKATRDYIKQTNDEVIIQYTLIDSYNDCDEAAKQLVNIMEGLRGEVHIIPFNSFPGSLLREPNPIRVQSFVDCLKNSNIATKLKKSYGVDVYAGCGQLGDLTRELYS